MNNALTINDLTDSDLLAINGGLAPWGWMLLGYAVGKALDALGPAIGTAVGNYVNDPVIMGTSAQPTGNEMSPYTDPLM